MKTILKFRPRGQTYFLGLVLLIFLSAEARGELYSFTYNTNQSGFADDLSPQITVDVLDLGYNEDLKLNQVEFKFNFLEGDFEGSIKEIYFDDGSLLGLSIVVNGPGDVDFKPLLPNPSGKVPNMPDADFVDPDFEASAGFAAEAENPAPTWGLDPGEYVSMIFNLQSKKAYADVLAAIALGFTDPELYTGDWYSDSLRIGLHIISIEDVTSDTFIMTPVPGAAILGLLGLGVAGIKLRKFS